VSPRGEPSRGVAGGTSIAATRGSNYRNRSPLRTLLTIACTALLLGACSTPSADDTKDPVRVVVSWTGRELGAFQAAVATFTDRTGIQVEYLATRDLEGTIDRERAAGQRIDLAGLSGPAHMAKLARAGVLLDVGDAIDVVAYKTSVAPTFVDLATVDGRLVGVFIKSTAKGLIWFNPRVYNLGTPLTWADLQRLAAQGARGSTRPWCQGLESNESSGWPGTDWVEQILLRSSGPRVYDDWVAGRLPWTSSPVREAFTMFGQVDADGAVAGGVVGALTTNFAAAGEPLFASTPGCLFFNQASFMPLEFADRGHKPRVDFDFFPFPEINPADDGSVEGGGDLFGLLSTRSAARQLLAFLVSTEGQQLLVSNGFGLSVNASVTSYPDDIAAREAALLTRADHFRFDASDTMPTAMAAAFNQAMLDFTAHPDQLDEILLRLDRVRVASYAG
jgi:alpha-glucoside transport system substrate-binding protein